MIQWVRDWLQARRERKVIEALVMLAMMDVETDCAVCDNKCDQCICGELDCD